MTDRPIIFSAPMVRALIEGRKTQTRRMLKLRGHRTFSEFGPSTTPGYDWHFRDAGMRWHDHRQDSLDKVLSYAPGDRLWVRETWVARMTGGWTIADARRRMFDQEILYRATSDDAVAIDGWWPSIFLPREFSRLTLHVTDVRVERLQDISREDAIAEGWGGYMDSATDDAAGNGPRTWYRKLWNSLHGPGAWDANPWVAAITFTVHHGNIDEVPHA